MMEKELPHDTIVPFKESSLSKKEQVALMFDRIALRYDLINRFLSGGIDMHWRKKAILELKELQPAKILDVATGTADMPILLLKYLQADTVTGIDISEGMLNLGRKKILKLQLAGKIVLESGDSENMNFSDGAFDAVTVAFGVRNYQNLRKGLKEMLRVLKPGGKLVVLEFSQPKSAFKGLYHLYMKLVAPGIGNLLSSNREAYQYLNKSVNAFPEGDDFLAILDETGFRKTYLKTLSLGICTIYCGYR
jgi:demethylmenaquinone methyltransferase/2-methoxy-6-polyprenyl-1,4-benzoquinol methylase